MAANLNNTNEKPRASSGEGQHLEPDDTNRIEIVRAVPDDGSPLMDPRSILVTELLQVYAAERADRVMAGDRIRYAMMPLVKFWAGKTVAAVTRQACEAYGRWRKRSDGAVRTELSVLWSSIDHEHAEGSRIRRPNSRSTWYQTRELS